MKFSDIPQFPRAHYNCTVDWTAVEDTLTHWQKERYGARLDLNPDYQRAHVWTRDQQVAYIEYALQGGEVGRNIIFNCPGWQSDYRGPFELVDGKQRLEAVRAFMRGDIPAFGHFISEFADHPRMISASFNFQICKIEGRENILKLYLNINAGGTPHTKEELDKVRRMLENKNK
jgi:hypothetical protein